MLIEREREKFNYFGKTNYTSIYRAFHLKTQETVCKYYERIIFIFIFVCFNDTSMLCACDVCVIMKYLVLSFLFSNLSPRYNFAP